MTSARLHSQLARDLTPTWWALDAPPILAAPRPARVVRKRDASNARRLLRLCQRGDLLMLGDSERWRVYGVRGGAHVPSTRFDSYGDCTIGLATTDLYADALAHYRDMFAAEERAFRARCARVGIGLRRARLSLQVRPRDAGLPAAFTLQPADWLLCRQWRSLTVVWYRDEWWISDVDFGNGCNRVLGPFSSVWHQLDDALPAAPDEESLYRDAVGAQTRNLAQLVEAYRQTLKTGAVVRLEFRAAPNCRLPDAQLFNNICDVFASHHWRKVGWPVHHMLDGADHINGLAVYATGPLVDFDRAKWTDELALLYIDGDGPKYWPMTIDANVFVADPLRHTTSTDVAASLAATWPLADAWCREFADGATWPMFQWRATHNAVFGAALALASLHLPAYVVLAIVEWLPELRSHVHIQVLRLIEAVRASVRRVYAARSK